MLLGTDRSRYTAIPDARFAIGGRYYRNQVHQVALRAYAAVATPEIPAENQAIPGTGHRQLDRGEIACEQDGKLISRLFEASAKESIGMEVYPDGVVLTPPEQAFCCLYAVIRHEEAMWYLDYLHRTHMG